MTSRSSGRRGLEDDEEDNFIPQAPERDQELKKTPAGSPQFVPDIAARHIQGIDMEAKKAAAQTAATASSPGAIVLASKEQPDNDTEPDTAEGSLGSYLDATSATKTSVAGVGAQTSTSVTDSTGTARVSKARALDEERSEDQPETKVGAVAVEGLSSRNALFQSASTYRTSNEGLFEGPPQAIDEGQPLEATVVADRVTSYEEEADIECQVQARMRSEAEDIADMVHRRIFQNTAMAVVHTDDETTSSATKSEGDKRRKKICILLVAVLLIAGAIGTGVGVAVSNKSPAPAPTSPPSEPTGQCSFCFDGSTPGNLDTNELYDTRTCAEFRESQIQLDSSDPDCAFGQAWGWLACGCPTLPPAPENATCMLCKDGASPLDSSSVACSDYATFVAHAGSDPLYSCDDFVASVLEAGCVCPGGETNPPVDSTATFRSVLVSVSEVGLDDPNSTQFQALKWIANVDPANTVVGLTDTETIRQRYVAAVLYYALGGEGWTNDYNFLSGDDICLWNQNNFSGISCGSTPGDVQTLRLSDNGLVRSIPEEIGYFSDLRTIEMTDGAITGTLPSSLADLNLLTELDLATNALTGTIPDFIYTHAQLTDVRLSFNSFTGTIHSSLGNSPRLEAFEVFQNELTGPIPAAVGQSSVLTFVYLAVNSLTGTIPEFSLSSQMEVLGLGGNKLVGSIPSSIGQLTSLQIFRADNNELTGTIPDLSGNALLQSLHLNANRLTGDIGTVFTTTPPKNLVEVMIDGNSMNGTLPSTIGQYTALTSLRLRDNNIRGTIPTEVGLLTALATYFLLDTNQFTGSIPSEIGRLTKLAGYLQLYDNNFTGTLPSTLGSLVSLENWFFNNNALEGPIPTELAQCQQLKILSLEVNQLTGNIGPVINTLPPSLTGLDLTYNLLSGTVPTSIGTFADLDYLDLAVNYLNGTIPSELGLLSKLTSLYLNSNKFTGPVPTSLASLPSLQFLSLSNNILTGNLDAFCNNDFEFFAANTCAQVEPVELQCACCKFTHCCDPNVVCSPISI